MNTTRVASKGWRTLAFLSLLLAAGNQRCGDPSLDGADDVWDVDCWAAAELLEMNDEDWFEDDLLDVLDEEAGEGFFSGAALPARHTEAPAPVPPVRTARDRPASRPNAGPAAHPQRTLRLWLNRLLALADSLVDNLDSVPAPGGEAARGRPKPEARLWLDDLKYVHRTEITNHPGGMVAIVVKHDGRRVMACNINCRMRYRHHSGDIGTYEFYLEVFDSKTREHTRISNVVAYTIGMGDDPRTWLYVPVEDFVDYPPREELTASVELDENNTVTRSTVGGPDLESLGWLVKFNGHQVLHRSARNESHFRYWGNQPGRYSLFLTSWTGSKLCYGRISNIVTYTLP